MTTYTEDFKLTIVKLAESGHRTIELSKEYGVGKSTINHWRRAYKENGNHNISQELSPEHKRIRELEKQLRDTALERDILKKAVRIFSKND